ncbi:histidine kinase [Gordonia sp. HY002]|uniref:sensor histidine kinase n=1 Tax=Gordonia zhenghanii TaxID=2911516 RepID=UPI001F016286|nr:histidine kinase [Gordonia zhenghanii]MCF8571500.1 histidine kinase [Gordonia zhenghanii]
MRPVDYQPTLNWWGHTWRVIGVLVISGVGWAPRIGYQWTDHRWWFCLDLFLGLVALVVAMRYRRTHPVLVATATALMTVVSTTASGPAVLALVSLSTRRRWKEIVPQALLTIVTMLASEYVTQAPDEAPLTTLDWALFVVIAGFIIAWGMYLGSRRELLASWRARALLTEAEQAARVREAQSAERARIAREMHDVLAHRISAVSMHAGALAFRDDLSPGEVKETAQTIQNSSRQALTELREVLGVLRDGPGDADPELPQATVADLDELIEENRRTGMRIDVHVDVDVDTLPTVLGRTVYRCVQEALTNARKHAPASRVRLSVVGSPGRGIDIRVENPLSLAAEQSPPESGFGLVGLAERVELAGGRQEHRTTGGDTFVLTVWLPWQS